MPSIGTPAQPLRVAVIGAGPAAFYAADHLLKQPGLNVEVDMFDRLPAPHGLVRYGVAPDHPKIKTVTRAYDATAANPRFRFFGNVELGRHVTLDDLRRHYHQIVFATGAQTDRRMGIPGEDLAGSHPATEFVAWYNGHPDYCECQFDLSVERAAVVGVGNVAIDVARMLVRTPEELEATDVADYALDALRKSRVREVFLLGRRGPAQAAFTNPEIKEIGEMADADVIVRPDEVALDPLSQAELDASHDRELDGRSRSCRAMRSESPRAAPGACTCGSWSRRSKSLATPRAASQGCAWCATRSSRTTRGRSPRRRPASSRISTWGWCFGRWGTSACRFPASRSTSAGA